MQCDVCFVHFRTLDLDHLDAAWYSLSRQDFTRIRRVIFLDNNTEVHLGDIYRVLDRYPLPVPLAVCFDKHGRNDRTQSWSVNRVTSQANPGFVFFSRSDYILHFDAVSWMLNQAISMEAQGLKPFVSGWCWQMAYDREAQNIDARVDIEQYNWREKGMEALLQHPFAFRFHETDQDAGVWLTKKEFLSQAGGLNEGLVSWGYQQSEFQRRLRGFGVTTYAIQDYLFAHQHHYAVRDFNLARAEYNQFGKG